MVLMSSHTRRSNFRDAHFFTRRSYPQRRREPTSAARHPPYARTRDEPAGEVEAPPRRSRRAHIRAGLAGRAVIAPGIPRAFSMALVTAAAFAIGGITVFLLGVETKRQALSETVSDAQAQQAEATRV